MATQPHLVLINPVPSNSVGYGSGVTKYEPLALGILAAMTPPDWRVTLLDEMVEPLRDVPDADAVAITCFTTSLAPRAYEVAEAWRRRGVPVIMGGNHPSMLPDEALQFASSVVTGEAETVWPQVIADLEAGRLQSRYTGGMAPIESWVNPRRDLFHPSYPLASVQTTRGCPFDCEFCSVPRFNGRALRMRPVDDVLDELAAIPKKNIFFVDDNLIGYGRRALERTKCFFEGMIRREVKKRWWTQCSINVADDEEVLRLAARSGCQLIFIGFESVTEEVVQGLNKNRKAKEVVETYRRVVDTIHRHGIAVLGSFILGLDDEGPSVFDATARFILEAGIDVAQVTFLTPLPGTPLWERLEAEGRMLFRNFPEDWGYFYFQHVTYAPKDKTVGDLYRGLLTCDTLLEGNTPHWRALKTLVATRRPMAALWAWKTNRAMAKIVAASADERRRLSHSSTQWNPHQAGLAADDRAAACGAGPERQRLILESPTK
ncbi:MAG: B12-binding domain-containing radical SAM protein [Candidatus Tectimicrobiota bacterium]